MVTEWMNNFRLVVGIPHKTFSRHLELSKTNEPNLAFGMGINWLLVDCLLSGKSPSHSLAEAFEFGKMSRFCLWWSSRLAAAVAALPWVYLVTNRFTIY